MGSLKYIFSAPNNNLLYISSTKLFTGSNSYFLLHLIHSLHTHTHPTSVSYTHYIHIHIPHPPHTLTTYTYTYHLHLIHSLHTHTTSTSYMHPYIHLRMFLRCLTAECFIVGTHRKGCGLVCRQGKVQYSQGRDTGDVGGQQGRQQREQFLFCSLL